MNAPVIIKVLPADQIDRRLETARCAAPALPSDLANAAAVLTRSRSAASRVVATWHWYTAHRAEVEASRRN